MVHMLHVPSQIHTPLSVLQEVDRLRPASQPGPLPSVGSQSMGSASRTWQDMAGRGRAGGGRGWGTGSPGSLPACLSTLPCRWSLLQLHLISGSSDNSSLPFLSGLEGKVPSSLHCCQPRASIKPLAGSLPPPHRASKFPVVSPTSL